MNRRRAPPLATVQGKVMTSGSIRSKNKQIFSIAPPQRAESFTNGFLPAFERKQAQTVTFSAFLPLKKRQMDSFKPFCHDSFRFFTICIEKISSFALENQNYHL